MVPLLVTDNLEGELESRSLETVRQLAFSISLLQSFGAAGAELRRFNDDLSQTFGRDLNSLMTVSRITDNTIGVRLGAQIQPDTGTTREPGHEMIPRTHDRLLRGAGTHQVLVRNQK